MVMYKIDRRGGVQKSYTRTDPNIFIIMIKSRDQAINNIDQRFFSDVMRDLIKSASDISWTVPRVFTNLH